jgi:hypothetical protein
MVGASRRGVTGREAPPARIHAKRAAASASAIEPLRAPPPLR